MFSLMKKRLGIPGVISVIALVFAMAGGAYAAKSVVITKLSQISPSVQKKLKGKAGPAGAPGAKGDTGARGDTGAAGAPGKEGPQGPQGKEGAPGKAGEDGEAGEPWVPDNTLPSEATETGVWNISPLAAGGVPVTARAETDLSFSIPLENEIPAANVHFEPAGGFTGADAVACPGSAAEPEAEPGHLCVYLAFEEATEWESLGNESIIKVNNSQLTQGASRSGAILLVFVGAETRLRGTWAVTAP